MIKLGSLFDGSGGFPLAGVIHGIEPVWASEIEPFPIRVTKNRFPNMKHLGSVTDVDGNKVEPVDIITFGSPCQDLSVAGKQLGIHDGERSNLFFEAIRIIKEMRDATSNQFPRFAVWENVPGAFSSNKGEDFRAVLQAFAEICEGGCGVSVPMPPKGKWLHAGTVVGNGWSVAWRVYDAQFWGVPQRRKRIYLVADFRSERAGEILFKPESLSGHSETGGKEGEGTSGDAEGGTGGSNISFAWNNSRTAGLSSGETSPTIKATRSGNPAVCYKCGAFCAGASPMARSIGWNDKVSPTLKSANAGLSMHAVCYSVENHGNDSRVTIRDDDKCQTMTSRMGTGGGNVPMVLMKAYGISRSAMYGGNGSNGGKPVEEDIQPTMTAMGAGAVCVGNGQLHQTELGDRVGALNCMHDQQAIITEGKLPRKYIIRRLTPTECARLQGFPDWWTDGAEGSDSAKYKLWGNGIALPCAEDVIGRCAEELRRQKNAEGDAG